ncbi:MAG: hypothetical protein HY592_00940 [Candidatus Omnitrophica bacterium]|nr:hypothetical protein [Candidatus Omnitrophota bacterium]
MKQLTQAFKSPLFFLTFLIVVILTISLISVSSQNAGLRLTAKNLTDESKKLADSLKSLELENQELAEKMEKAGEDTGGLKDSLEEAKRENESLKLEIQKVRESLDSLTEEKTYLEEILLKKNKEIEKSQPAVTTDSATIDARLREKDEELKRLAEQNKILTDKLDRLYKTANEKIAEITIAKIALEETVSEARRQIANEWSTVNLGSISTKQTAPAAAAPKETPRAPKTEGRVLAINDQHGFVVVDFGSGDLKSDSSLVVKKGQEEIATLSVLEVRDAMTACNVRDLKSGRKIAAGDIVLLKKI